LKSPSRSPQFDLQGELSAYPGGFSFSNASPADKNRVLHLIGRLLGQERFGRGAAATADLETALQALQAHDARAWLNDARHQLDAMTHADGFLAKHAAGADQTLEPATRAYDAAAKKLLDAQRAADAAKAARDAAKAIADQVEKSRTLLATQDAVLQAAWSERPA
jgi:hypothetical protein